LDDGDEYVRIGERVLVHDVYGNYLGRGIFIGYEEDDELPFPIVHIILPTGDLIYGFECWWMPESKAISLN